MRRERACVATPIAAASGRADWFGESDAMAPRLLVRRRNRVDGAISGHRLLLLLRPARNITRLKSPFHPVLSSVVIGTVAAAGAGRAQRAANKREREREREL